SKDGSPQPVVLRIRGCRIGDAQPMLDVLRRAFNVDRLTAPRHYATVFALKTTPGFVEYRQYYFGRILDKPILTFKDLETAFRKHEFRLIDGQAVSEKHWDEWFKPFKAALGKRALTPPLRDDEVATNEFQVPARFSKVGSSSALAEFVYYPF